MNWAALVIGVIGALGAGSWVGGWWERRHASAEADKQRAHASAEARVERNYALRLEGYKAASRYLERQLLWVQFTLPMITPAPEPPELLDANDELSVSIELGATISIAASDVVRTAMQKAVKAQEEFHYAVEEVRAYRADPTARSWDPNDSRSPNLKLEKARKAALEAIQDAQTAMRDELADL